MDSAALAVPVGVSRKVDVNGAAVTMIALRHPPMTPIEDFGGIGGAGVRRSGCLPRV
jgi:hypothetical protein